MDRRARALKISRNRLIVKALERELANTSEWSDEVFEALAAHAVARESVLVTANAAHRIRVPGLRVEDWAK